MHPQIFNLQNERVAVLQNAYKIGYTKIKNNLWTAHFTLPLDDSKVELVNPKYFIDVYDHDRYIGKFIVNPKNTVKNESTNEISYHCEHVLSLLHSDVLFGYHQYTNYTTDVVLNGLIDSQETPHWRLGQLDFTRYFHYGWENEDSLLNAIMSVPKPFNEPYIWTWDDTTYPFTLNLVRPDDTLKGTVIAGKNLKGIQVSEDPTNIVTRIYPLGAGEGINQLTIADANNGVVYLEDADAIAKYGLHKRIWADMRFEDAESLMASGQAILDKFKHPVRSVSIDYIDYSMIDKYKLSDYDVGDVLLVYDEDTETDEEIRLEKIDKGDIYGATSDMQLELGSVLGDITTTFADLEKKQLVNETYSQGATNIDSRDFADNCDANFPAVIRFPIPDDVVNINEMSLTFETVPYRAYSRAIEGGGAVVSSTAGGGGTSTSTGGGGGVVTSSGGGGGGVVTSGDGGIDVITGLDTTLSADGHTHDYYRVYGHKHNITMPTHSHSISLSDHTHSISVPNHTHSITLPNHTHEIDHGIFEYSSVPNDVMVFVDGDMLPVAGNYGDRIDLIPYLAKDSGGRIQRGRFVEIVLKPNGLARINATVSSRLFIQSRIGTVM